MLRRIQEHLERGGRLLLDYTASLTDQQLIAKAEEHERKVQQAEMESAAVH